MFHTTHIHVPRNRRPSALRTFITSSSFGPADPKEPLRRGILLTAVAIVLLLIGSILTWLGFNDVFGGRMSMTGPLLIALSLLLLLLSFRQFLLARKRNTNSHSSMQLDAVAEGTVTAVVVNHDDGLHPSTIIVDRYNRITYNNPLTVHRHSVDDCAPPSYHEVTQHSSSSNTPSCTTHDGQSQDELPPTYEESVSSGVFSSQGHHVSSTHQAPHREAFGCRLAFSERAVYADRHPPEIPPRPSQGRGVHETEDMSSQRCCAQVTETIYQCGQKSLPLQTRTLPCLHLDTSLGGSASHNSALTRPLPSPLYPQRHSLTPPPIHMSAPSSPRQLSAPPSPHPYSAPSSPHQISPHPHSSMTPPPQYMSLLPTPHHLSTPASPQPISAPPSPGMYSAGAVYNYFSAPPSPHPVPHSLTPPPQYTSAPPSPRQLSAPASPHMFSGPLSPCSFPGQTLAHPVPHFTTAISPSYPHPQLHQLVAPPSHLQFSSPTSQPHPPPHPGSWAVSLKPGSAHDGYTCFTYNFVTPLPVETSTATHTLRTHTQTHQHPTTVNYPATQADTQNTGYREAGQVQSHQGHGHPQLLPLCQGEMYGSYNQPTSISRGESSVPGQVVGTPCGRTDIQANI